MPLNQQQPETSELGTLMDERFFPNYFVSFFLWNNMKTNEEKQILLASGDILADLTGQIVLWISKTTRKKKSQNIKKQSWKCN